MADQAYRLLRIVIIDSFWQGQVNELKLTGHTQLEGTNGAGKTSLMRLLPLFYGMRPSDIVSKVDQSKNFADFYLPRDSSMLVYEYQRPFGQTCMVLAISDGRSVHFKLIDRAYDASQFISAEGKPYTASEVERSYKKSGAFCSNFLAVDKYRQVIQNLRSGRKIKDIRQLQQRFSFSDRPCPHIDKVVNGTIEKKLDFDAIKRMLVAIASDHLARSTGEEKEQIALNKEEISRWLADMKASQEVKKVSAKIAQWQNDFSSLEQLLNKLSHLHAQVNTHIVQLNERQQQLSEDKLTTRAQLSQVIAELEQEKQKFQSQINQLNAQIEADQSKVDLLDADKLSFDDDDAASYLIRAQEAEPIQEQLNEVIQIIHSFEGDISKIADKFDALLQDLKLQSATFEAKSQERQSLIKDQSNEQLNHIASQYQNQLNSLNESLNQQFLELSSNSQSFKAQLQYLQQALSEPRVPVEIQQAIEDNGRRLSDSKRIQTLLLQENNELFQELNRVEKLREQSLNKHLQETRYLEELRSQYLELEQQLLPNENSLHYYLEHEANAPDWKQNIGRLFSPQLLSRTDLSPSYLETENAASIYGLSIDLDQLQDHNSLLLSEAQLREKAHAVDLERQQQLEKITQLDEHLAQLNKQVKIEQGNISTHKQRLQACDLEQQQLTTEQERLSLKKQMALNEAAKVIAEDITELQLKITNSDKQRLEFEQSKKEQLHQLNNQSLEKRLVVESDRDSQLELLTEQALKFSQELADRKRDYNKQKKTALEKLDPDGEVDKRSLDKKRLEQILKECAVFGQKARAYEIFMSERYCHRDKLSDQNQERSMLVQAHQSSVLSLEQDLGEKIRLLKCQLKKILEQHESNDELIIQLEKNHKLCEVNAIEAKADLNQANCQADLAVTFCNDWLSQFITQEKRLSQEISKFNDNLRQRHSSSQVFENWQKLVADNDHYQGAEQLFKYRNAISDLLSSAEQLRKITGQSVIVNANMINEFYQHIENFGRRINQIGKNLSTSVTALAHFKALADINVSTVMKQEELDYWGPLQQFSRVFDHCRDQLREGSDEIDEQLIESMSRLAQYLPSEGLHLEHHKLFDIEFEITEKGQVKYARNARQLKSISSTGLSYLAMLSLFAGILQMLRGNSESASKIILPVDELGELAAENIDLLLQMFQDSHIQMLSASPSTDRHVLALYDRHYKLKDKRIYNADIPVSKLEALLLKSQDLVHEAEQSVANAGSGS